MAPSLTVLRDHTHWTHHTRWDCPGRVIGPTQRPLPDNTQHSKETNIHYPAGIRTHNPSQRVAVDHRLRSRGPWDRHLSNFGSECALCTEHPRNKPSIPVVSFGSTASFINRCENWVR